MTWLDRLQQGAYTPDGGQAVPFQFEDVAQAFTLRGAVYECPDATQTLIKRTGSGSNRYPLRVYFTGENHDQDADDFLAALRAADTGRLDHPFYGSFDVIPFGDVRREDPVTTAGNQTIITVEFWRATADPFPIVGDDFAGQALAASEQSVEAAADEVASLAGLFSVVEGAQLTRALSEQLGAMVDALRPLAAVRQDFDTVAVSLTRTLAQPYNTLTAALQSARLALLPAETSTRYRDTFTTYAEQAAEVTAETPSTLPAFVAAEQYAVNVLNAYARAALRAEYGARADALTAAANLLALRDTVTDWREENRAALGAASAREVQDAYTRAVSAAVSFLVRSSFSLQRREAVTLTKHTTPLNLCAEYYGKVGSETLDFFINTNSLAWSEVLELAPGREVVFYV